MGHFHTGNRISGERNVALVLSDKNRVRSPYK